MKKGLRRGACGKAGGFRSAILEIALFKKKVLMVDILFVKF